MKLVLTLAGVATAWTGIAAAQTDEIVVTGTRIERFEDEEVPAVSITVRPDYVTDVLTISNDSREGAERERDLLRTLDRVLAAADRRRDIEISAFKVVEDEDAYMDNATTFVVDVPKSRDDRGDLVEPTGRDDTSMIELLVKTPVDDGLTFDAAEERLTVFAEGIDGVGRTTVFNDEEYAVSVRDLQRHRAPLLEAVSEEALRMRTIFPNSVITIGGLEDQVRYVRTDLLDLTLYFPYSLTIETK